MTNPIEENMTNPIQDVYVKINIRYNGIWYSTVNSVRLPFQKVRGNDLTPEQVEQGPIQITNDKVEVFLFHHIHNTDDGHPTHDVTHTLGGLLKTSLQGSDPYPHFGPNIEAFYQHVVLPK